MPDLVVHDLITDTTRFYADLPRHEERLQALLATPAAFQAAPADWHVILTDVRGSTRAVGDGRQHVVNLVATGSIIAALNIAYRAGVEIPFFFGGDGATLMAPPSLAHAIEAALVLHRDNSRASFDLDLRVGRMSVADVYAQGFRLDLAKADVGNGGLVLPIALGEGLQYAEKVIKADDAAVSDPQPDAELDLDGMECRWDSIRPPEDHQEVVCLIVVPRDPERQATILAEVMSDLDGIYGPLMARNPVSRRQLKLQPTLGRISTEMRARLGRFDLGYLLGTWLRTQIAPLWFRLTRGGAHYMERLVQLSDTLMIDGRVSTVISGTGKQRTELVKALQAREARGDVMYGLEVCAASVMSCYVRDREDQHIHFVDGQGGGYTRAATQLKRKLAG